MTFSCNNFKDFFFAFNLIFDNTFVRTLHVNMRVKFDIHILNHFEILTLIPYKCRDQVTLAMPPCQKIKGHVRIVPENKYAKFEVCISITILKLSMGDNTMASISL